MSISSVNTSAATYSFNEAQNISKEQMEALISANQQVQQAPMKQKMVLAVNAAIQNGTVDVYA